jgi:hypothetical protein
MRYDAVDRILSKEQQIIPSAGFIMAVMGAVRGERAVPPPIPFPWRRALPGALAAILALVALSIAGTRLFTDPASTQQISWPVLSTLTLILGPRHAVGASWIATSLIGSFIAVRLSMCFARREA